MRHDETFLAVTSINHFQYHLIVTSVGKVCERNYVAGGIVAGVLQNKPVGDGHATVRMMGRSRVQAGTTAITAGAEITSDASAMAVAVASGDFAIGQAITGVAASGIFEAVLGNAGWKGQ